MIAEAGSPPEILQYHPVTQERTLQLHSAQPGVSTDDRVANPAAADPGPPLDGDVGTDFAPLDADAVLDVDRIVYGDAGKISPARCALPKQYFISLQQGVELTAVVPSANLCGQDSLAVLDHPLKCVRQIPFSLVGRIGEHVIDALPQAVGGFDVVEPDIGELADRRGRLLHDFGHVSFGIGDYHSEPLVILHFLGPDDAIGVGTLDQAEIGLEDGVNKDDQYRPGDIGPGQIDGAR